MKRNTKKKKLKENKKHPYKKGGSKRKQFAQTSCANFFNIK